MNMTNQQTIKNVMVKEEQYRYIDKCCSWNILNVHWELSVLTTMFLDINIVDIFLV